MRSAEERIQRYIRGIELGGAANVETAKLGMHDDIKTNVCALIELAKKVYEEYGDAGLCVIALHVLLDKTPSVIRGVTIAQRIPINMGSMSEEEFLDLVYRHLGAEISSFTVLKYWDKIKEYSTLAIIYDIIEKVGIRIGRNTRRNKRKLFEAIFMNTNPDCVLSNKKLIIKIISIYDNVYRGLKDYWKDICCTAKKNIRDTYVKSILNKILICNK